MVFINTVREQLVCERCLSKPEPGNELFTSGWHILETLDPVTVTIQDDDEWHKFPEIGVAYQKLTQIESCYAVAFSSRFGKWGVGLSGRKKDRESAARLALALANPPLLLTGSSRSLQNWLQPKPSQL